MPYPDNFDSRACDAQLGDEPRYDAEAMRLALLIRDAASALAAHVETALKAGLDCFDDMLTPSEFADLANDLLGADGDVDWMQEIRANERAREAYRRAAE